MVSLGRTGLDVFPVCVGGAVLAERQTSRSRGADRDADAGGNFIDTANRPGALSDVQDRLGTAANWSTFDTYLDCGMIANAIKHDRIDQAAHAARGRSAARGDALRPGRTRRLRARRAQA